MRRGPYVTVGERNQGLLAQIRRVNADDCASLLANQLFAEIFLVHAVQATKPTRASPDVPQQEAVEKDNRWIRARKRLQNQVSILKAVGVTAHGTSVVGAPGEALLKEAARRVVDVIVIGTQGRKGAHRLLDPSVAEQIVRRAGCPVLSVKCPLSRDTVSMLSADASDNINSIA